MDESRIRGSQIPAFGNWEYVNDLPITQYFECARQAGLIRYSSSSGECDNHNHNHHHHHHHNQQNQTPPDLYTVDFIKPRTAPRPKQGKGREKKTGGTQVKEGGRKQAGNCGKVFDVTVTELPSTQGGGKRHPQPAVNGVKKKQQQFQYDAGSAAQPRRAPRAVDEDLYKIPPELLRRKRRLGFFSRCLVPPCAV
ncbi:hypothetical protein SOVF_163220 [Spinacia oleracea]|uniref:RIN4 pathogenic type III effector avirulence factor Avr cleavage site domain-containing protein n=1 Tax=Spinacia oleracea TaxID=3562 RepID=A0A9R0ITL7_SPIOL|nr:uncharacterized protein LOC110794717 [Spinacia oleracea]KNA08376.1 hypothetical protein SOVF_163220 [Spinacia oleracea]